MYNSSRGTRSQRLNVYEVKKNRRLVVTRSQPNISKEVVHSANDMLKTSIDDTVSIPSSFPEPWELRQGQKFVLLKHLKEMAKLSGLLNVDPSPADEEHYELPHMPPPKHQR